MSQISTARPLLRRPTYCANTLKKTPKDSPHFFCKINRPLKAYETSPPPHGDCEVDMSITG